MNFKLLIGKMTTKKVLPYFIISCITIFLFCFSFIWYLISNDTCRRTFIFPSADKGQYIIEYRNLTDKPHQGDINLFVEEILLGSTVERTRNLFTPGTRLLSCFKRNGILYINLSSNLLEMGEGVIEIREGIELLKKNIMRNFSGIDSIEVFIEGKCAFEK